MRSNTVGHTLSEMSLPRGAPRLRLSAPTHKKTTRCEACQVVMLIGSRGDCDLSISHSEVSKIHCALVNTGHAIIATDLCTRCGTFVNDKPVSAAALWPGDTLRVGSVRVAVRFLDPPDDAILSHTQRDEQALALDSPLTLTVGDQKHELTALPVVIGRRQACRVVLDTPDVSLAHALLLAIDGHPAVYDLGSRSGTYVNSERVTLAWLCGGDRLCIGGEELTVDWDNPQTARCNAGPCKRALMVRPGTALKASDAAIPLSLRELRDFGPVVDGLTAQINASQILLEQRASQLDEREQELNTRANAVRQESAQLSATLQLLARQEAELAAARKRLEEEQVRFEAQRAELERERASLQREKADLKKSLTGYKAKTRELAEREAAIEQREAALAAAEDVMAARRAELAKREQAYADAVRGIEQFRAVLGDAQRVFGFAEAAGSSPATSATAAGTGPRQGSPDTEHTGTAHERVTLPAPLVDKPLFPRFETGG